MNTRNRLVGIYSQIRVLRRHHSAYNASESWLAPSTRTSRLTGMSCASHSTVFLMPEPGLRIFAINNWTNAHIFELVLGWGGVAGGWWWVSSSTCGGLNVKSSLIYVVTNSRTCTHVFELVLGCCGVAGGRSMLGWCDVAASGGWWWMFSCSTCGGLKGVKSSLIYVVTHRRTWTYTHIFELALGWGAWCWWWVSMFWCSLGDGLNVKIISIRRRSSIIEHMLTPSW